MSSAVVPVCASCGNSAVMSISCTKCFQICCYVCFDGLVSAMATAKIDIALMTARTCRKCSDAEAATALMKKPDVVDHAYANTIGSAADQGGLCGLHGKKRKLYCVNCSVGICSGCIDLGEQHDFHRVDNLAAVYLEKVSRIESKRIRTEKLNDELHARNAAYRRNLELIEKEEDSALKEIEAIAEKSKQEVARITTVRKEFLRKKLKVPALNGAILDGLKNTAQQLSPYGLLEQLSEFEDKYDELLAQDNEFSLQKVNDIHCDLIPEYQFTKIVFRGFKKVAIDAVHVFPLKTAYDAEWKFTVKKADMLKVESSADDPEVQKLRHVLIVIISHPDYSKSVNQCFELEGPNNIFDVVCSSFLVKEGYCTPNGHLVVNIGIRCFNALIEKQLLSYLHRRTKKELPDLTDGTHLIMEFCPNLVDLKVGAELESYRIEDDKNRLWVLTVGLTSKYVSLLVQLMNGPKTSCQFFVELIHSNPKKTILNRSASSEFDPNVTNVWGWYKFIKLDTLKNDVGFHPHGKLHIRFGVRPLPSTADEDKTPSPSVTNA